MTANFTQEQLKLSVAKMCLTIGWHTTMTTPIDLLTDILCNYLTQLGKLTNDYASGFGIGEAGIEHLVLAFKDFHVNLHDLTEFIKCVDCPEPPVAVPLYPIPREDRLNFLKPGSKEVVTRQVHIHEHLPPMFPQLEEEVLIEESAKMELILVTAIEKPKPVFKRPAEIIKEVFKCPRILSDEETGHPTREISSVMMTTSGFLSPAREGRLPEAGSPTIAVEHSVMIIPHNKNDHAKIISKNIKKIDNLKDNDINMLKPFKESQLQKSISSLKNFVHHKTKQRHTGTFIPPLPTKNYMVVNEPKISALSYRKQSLEVESQIKFNKALAAARLKTEKFNTTITPISSESMPTTIVKPEQFVDKLSAEPDKQKVNILKKISVKTDRVDKNQKIKEYLKIESRESSPDLIIDESVNVTTSHRNLPKAITIELVHSSSVTITSPKKSPEKSDIVEKYYFDDYSPPGTPATPRTPEIVTHSPPLIKGEKHNIKTKHRKLHKYSSPFGVDLDMTDVEMERPNTPDSNIIVRPEQSKQTANSPLRFPFLGSFSGPGLIPNSLAGPLFSNLPIPSPGLSTIGHSTCSSLVNSSKSTTFISSVHTAVLPSRPISTLTPAPVVVPATASRMESIAMCDVSSAVKEEIIQQPLSSTLLERNTSPLITLDENSPSASSMEKKIKEHKKEKKDKLKKKNKKNKHNKSEKKKLKEEKKEKSRIKKEKREKKKNKESQNGSISSIPKLTLKLPAKAKLNIKVIVKQEEKMEKAPSQREMSPELAKFSALVTGQPKPKGQAVINCTSTTPTSVDTFTTSSADSITIRKTITPKAKPTECPVATTYAVERSASSYIDSNGKKIWICPSCGVQDDGSPMIGCDDCDAWYHWVCVGIQVPPDDNEDWYCIPCIGRNSDLLKRGKKRKRKDI